MSERKIEKFEQKLPETQAAAEAPCQEGQVGENLFDRGGDVARRRQRGRARGAAVAANVLADGSKATADATQNADIDQSKQSESVWFKRVRGGRPGGRPL